MEPSLALYEIRLLGHLDDLRARQFPAMDINRTPDGVTVLTGPVADQAALHGLLSRIRDLGIVLISLHRIGLAEQPRPDANADSEIAGES